MTVIISQLLLNEVNDDKVIVSEVIAEVDVYDIMDELELLEIDE